MKIHVFLIVVLAFFVTCTQVSAASITNESAPGTVLVAEGGAINFNYSPGVSGMYVTEATSGNEQWFALATYHGGGKSFYGSTSDSSSIYKQAHDSAQVFADVTIPTGPIVELTPAVIDATTGEVTTPAVSGTADEYWLANSWTK